MGERVLVVGGGGREHAIAWMLSRSRRVEEVLVAPGNAGTAGEPGCRNVDVAATDLDGLVALAHSARVGLVVVGPEDPLVAGLVDRLAAAGIRAFGPTAEAARLEGSKAHCKEFLLRHGIPTGAAAMFTDAAEALAHLAASATVPVLKASGLAAGKGVIVAETRDEAAAAITEILVERRFGDAGAEVLLEERLRRTTSGWATATGAPTPAGWARSTLRPSPTTRWSSRWAERSSPPRCELWPPRAAPTAACSTRG